MEFSIIPFDGAVCENGICTLHLSWEGTPLNIQALQWKGDTGWIEFNDGKANEVINALPIWAENALSVWREATAPKPYTPNTAELNKIIARSKLEVTDWTTIPDVTNPEISNPYLGNKEEFIAYRNIIRQYAVNPIDGDIDFPEAPTPQWVTL